MGYFKNLAIEAEERAMGIGEVRVNDGQIKYIKQDIATVTRGVIAHGCNYLGVMGAGVALVLKRKFPKVYMEYVDWLEQFFPDRKKALGRCQFIEINKQLFVANCITQGLGTGNLATTEAIFASLNEAFHEAAFQSLPIYLPKIGCGLGGLDWEKDVEPIIAKLASDYDEVHTYVCEI